MKYLLKQRLTTNPYRWKAFRWKFNPPHPRFVLLDYTNVIDDQNDGVVVRCDRIADVPTVCVNLLPIPYFNSTK